MDLDLAEIDDRLSQIDPGRVDYSNLTAQDATSAEDDIAIAEAINEIESELNQEKQRLFSADHLLDVDMNDIDANLNEINPSTEDYVMPSGRDSATAEDDVAIAEAIYEIESELKQDRKRLFSAEHVLDLDMNDIDANLKQISPTTEDYVLHSIRDSATAEDDLAIANAINEVESELKSKDKSMFNPTTVVMLLIAGGIVTSRLASMFLQS
eukprot:CAMPEP_0170369186 /NCGR_PEP_ID=MMETSP0117_2-20130122/7850_1 /TAXON_ID=400756 /ORGANISM="Durinskia baltica, Strain CSIRO CS-38" /LENGTH=210 /DNA_ID=CAMNT_0010623891 /DNA_START=52 /DNA_END=684 /DNA_ORIENTATION=+